MDRKPTPDPNIFIYPNGVYYYRGRPPHTDSRIERSLEARDFMTALVNKTKMLSQIESMGHGIFKKAGPLLEQFLEEEKARQLVGDVRASTHQNLEWAVRNYLLPFYRDMEIGKIDSRSFDRLRQRFGKKDYKNQRKHLTTFLRWCRDQKLIVHVPTFEVGKHKKRNRVILTNEEIIKVIQHSKGNLLLFVAMYLFQGMRSSEITHLRWDYIDLRQAKITLPPEATKTDEPREFPINRFVLAILSQRRLVADSAYVFPNARGDGKTPHMSKGGFNRPFKRMLKKAGIQRHLTPHDLRATFEKFAHINPNFTDTQREKMVGASAEVQRRVYLNSFTADDLRGLEQAVSFEGLDDQLDLLGGKLGGANVL